MPLSVESSSAPESTRAGTIPEHAPNTNALGSRAARPRTVTDSGLEPAPIADHAPASDATTDLHAALLTLPPRERACVVLRYLEDMPVATVAAELKLAEGSVKRYLADGVARLRALEATIDFAESHTIPVVEGRSR